MPGVRLDLGLAQSAIAYTGSAGSASGAFGGQRTLATGAVVGTYALTKQIELEPSARIFALWERDGAYTDSLGATQSSWTFATGRASLGSKISYRWQILPTSQIIPAIALYLDQSYTQDSGAALVVPSAVPNGPSTRVVSGISLATIGGAQIGLTAEAGGLGSKAPNWSTRARGSLTF